VNGLAEFVGLDTSAAARAMDCIEYRDSWGFGSIGFASAKFKECNEFFNSWTWLVMHGIEEDDRCLNRPEHIPISTWYPRMHNAIIRLFLQSGCDTLCIIEDDHEFPFDVLHRLRYKPENQEFDIVCASYVRRSQTALAFPMGWNIKEDSEEPWWVQFDIDGIEYEGTQEFDGAALGFVLIRRWVLEEMVSGENIDTYEWVKCYGDVSGDIPFYFKAHALGARVGVDRDNRVIHVGPYKYTHDDFKRQVEESYRLTAEQAEGQTDG
jgi:hypothetical protein